MDETGATRGGGPSGEHPARELVARLRPRPWDTMASVAFESAQEAINHVIGCYSALIAKENSVSRPDETRLQKWREARMECVAEQQALRSYDHENVNRVRATYSERAAELQAELRSG